MGVVPVIDDDRRPVNLQHVETAGDLFHVGGEGFRPGADDVQRRLQRDRRGDGRQGVFHLETDLSAERQGNAVQREDDLFALAFGDDDMVVAG